ncbi:DEKNAAC100047 [Brettanomyces naardenensis]|uniref:Histidine biosynthesis trifunctional protein n=1 Tax=Brettanomyces naardenensis TaxID=13370 RepID=A0A448YFP1_BRENA|nr:DEKNAAC100047 [Brettanomyces naardenensis]
MTFPVLPYFPADTAICPKLSLVGQVIIPFVPGTTTTESVTKYSTAAHYDVNLDYTSTTVDEKTIDQLLQLYNKGVHNVFAPAAVASTIASKIPNARLVFKVNTVAEAAALKAHQVALTSAPPSADALKQLSGKSVFVFFAEAAPVPTSIPSWIKSGATVVIKASDVTTNYDSPAPGKTPLIDYIIPALTTDRADGLYATVVTNPYDQALGLVYSSKQSIAEALKNKAGVYQSRTRGLWFKGATSGNTQSLVGIDADCDGDCLKFIVEQTGAGFCHKSTTSCFGNIKGLSGLETVLQDRLRNAPVGSYTKRLFDDEKLLSSKIREEADELIDARSKDEIAWEAADVLYFVLARCVKSGVTLEDITKNLETKSLRVTRRKGDAKPKYAAETERRDAEKKAAAAAALRAERIIGPNDRIIMQRVNADTSSAQEVAACLQRPIHTSADIMSLVVPIVERVKQEGDKALLDLTAKFDHVVLDSPVMKAPFPASAMQITDDVKKAIDLSFNNIWKFHEAQMKKDTLVVETCPGVICSRFARPIEKVGCYIPGGTAVLPSTSLMLSVPARVAGCKDIVFASPPGKDGKLTPEVVYVAHKVGAKCIVLAGGAQAIASMAYGTESIPKCDKIMGPGNQFVTAAKMFVSNDSGALCGIDMPAGPSEVLVIADKYADPEFVASDLLSQAEHGVDSQVLCIAVDLSEKELDALDDAVDEQANKLPRVEIVRKCISHSTTLQVKSYDEALALANQYAPEHLILQIKDAEKYVDQVDNAGSVFVGAYSPESCGDYSSGTNHTLPTYGYARMYSGVNTATFQKFVTSQTLTPEGLKSIGKAVMDLAAVEGLDAHRNAVKIRMEKLGYLPRHR